MSRLNDRDLLISETYSSKGYYGFANRFSDETDTETLEKLANQYKEFGFDSTELWNFDHTIIEFVLPRLKYYKDNSIGYPPDLEPETWDEVLNKIIYGFEQYTSMQYFPYDSEKSKSREEAIEYALDLFRKYFRALWD